MPESVADWQFYQTLAIAGTITPQEALAAVKSGGVPAALRKFIDGLPADKRLGAEMWIAGATTFQRRHPMTEAMGVSMGWSEDQLDAMWIAAAKL